MDAMDLSPRGIRTELGLNKPIYARTSAYGHFGRAPEADGGFSWERTDLADSLKSAAWPEPSMTGEGGYPSPSRAGRWGGARARLLRPAQGQAPARAARSSASPSCCRALRLALPPAGRTPRSRRPVPAPGRRGLARDRLRRRRAPRGPGGAPTRHRHHRRRALRQRRGQAPARASTSAGLRNVRIWDEDATALLARPAGCQPRPGLPALSRSLAQAPPAQAPLRLGRAPRRDRPRAAGPAACSASPATSTTTPAGPWYAPRRCPDLAWTARAATGTGRSPGPDWPGTRYEAKAARRRPPPDLPRIRPRRRPTESAGAARCAKAPC